MRLFVALPVPEEMQEKIIAETAVLRGRYPELKWVRQDALHLTLSFLGEMEEESVESIHEAMRVAAAKVEAFDMEFRGIGTFPARGRPRVVYLALERGAEAADRLSRELTGALGSLAEKDGKRFTPHLTLARVKKKGKTPDPEREGIDLRFAFTSEKLVLYRSHLSSKGARYDVLREARLGDEG